MDSYASKLAAELKQLKADHAALQAEIADTTIETTSDELEAVVNCFRPYKAQAVANVIALSEAAESESVRFAASRYIIEFSTKVPSADDEFKNLLSKIKVKAVE